jgi:amino acid transporter
MGRALASMVKGSEVITKILIVLLFFTLILSIMTAMAGSSRTLHQGGRDGWLPKYLGQVNTHGAPDNAMWTDLAVNLVLLLMSDYVFVLAVSNCNYLIFNFLNLNAGWIHRMDNPDVRRPWRCPTIMMVLGTILAYVNAFLLGAGANVWGAGTFISGWVSAALVVPVFCSVTTLSTAASSHPTCREIYCCRGRHSSDQNGRACFHIWRSPAAWQ